jgi:hypothetical protein
MLGADVCPAVRKRRPSNRAPWLHLSELCTCLCGRRESPLQCFLQPHVASGLLWWGVIIIIIGERGKHGEPPNLTWWRRRRRWRPWGGLSTRAATAHDDPMCAAVSEGGSDRAPFHIKVPFPADHPRRHAPSRRGASNRGHGPWGCRLAPPSRSSPLGELSPVLLPCDVEAAGIALTQAFNWGLCAFKYGNGWRR